MNTRKSIYMAVARRNEGGPEVVDEELWHLHVAHAEFHRAIAAALVFGGAQRGGVYPPVGADPERFLAEIGALAHSHGMRVEMTDRGSTLVWDDEEDT